MTGNDGGRRSLVKGRIREQIDGKERGAGDRRNRLHRKKACGGQLELREGHETFVLQGPEIGLDIDKLQTLLGFKKKGARLVEGSFSDHQSLVETVKKADVVIRAMSGVHFRSHRILLQLKLIEAIKEAGNVKRSLPSEIGIDSARMGNALEPGRVTFDEKKQVRRAIEDATIVGLFNFLFGLIYSMI